MIEIAEHDCDILYLVGVFGATAMRAINWTELFKNTMEVSG